MRGKVVLITGTSSGIGAGTAILFATHGCLLSLTGRNQDGLDDTKQKCVQAGARKEDVLLTKGDLQNMSCLAEIVDNTIQKFGKLDVLVNNAGCQVMSDLEHTTVEDYDTVMNTNLKSMFFLTQLATPHLIQSKGNVVNVSSALSIRPRSSSIVYCMSKAAVDHFTKTAALDLASKNIRINAVNPGIVQTNLSKRTGRDPTETEERAKRVQPLGRIGRTEEIANVILFLADDEQSSFITGTTFFADGGNVLKGPV